jgi:short-subunit dehydrogenase
MNKTVIWVTGATKGIGKAIVWKFASHHATVVFCARGAYDVAEMEANLRKEGYEAFGLVCDVADKQQLQNFAEQALLLAGSPNILVNNAGIFKPGSLLTESENLFEELMNVNVASAYHLARLALPSMIKRKSGYIFNMCSTASFTPYTNGGSYCISKFALLGFSKVLREELKTTGIRVTAVMPGATLTASWTGTELPATRFMKPEDVADAVWAAYQLSPQTVMEELVLRPQEGDLD